MPKTDELERNLPLAPTLEKAILRSCLALSLLKPETMIAGWATPMDKHELLSGRGAKLRCGLAAASWLSREFLLTTGSAVCNPLVNN